MRLGAYKRGLFHADDTALRDLPCVVLCANAHLARTLELYIHPHVKYYYPEMHMPGHLNTQELYSLEAAPIIRKLLLLKSQSTAKQLLWGLCFFQKEAAKKKHRSSEPAPRRTFIGWKAPS